MFTALLSAVTLAVVVAATQLDELQQLVSLKREGLIDESEFLTMKSKILEASNGGASNGEVATILTELGLDDVIPVFERHKISSKADLLLLSRDDLDRYMPTLDLRARVRVLAYLKTARLSAAAVDGVEADGHARNAQAVAQAIEKNNELLLGRVAEMIEDARLAPHTAVHQRALSADTAAAPRSLNAEGASMWLEDDDGKIVIGADADTDLARAKESVLSTSGAFRVGDVGDDACATAEDVGTLRWSAAEEGLQVCNGEDWKEAGGSVSDGGSVTTFEDHCTGCTDFSSGPGGVTDTTFESTTDQGFTLKISGWSYLRNYAGMGFLCNEEAQCNDKMKLEVEGLDANARYWWKVWGYDTRTGVDAMSAPSSTFTVSANGVEQSSGDFMHCLDLERCPPAAHAITAATGDGKIVLTWARTSAVGQGKHIYLSAFGIVGLGPAVAVPQFLGALHVASVTSAGPVIVGTGDECGVAQAGALRWQSADKRLEICNGEEYKAVYEPPPEVLGGTPGAYGIYQVNTFDNPGSHTLTVSGGAVTCDVLVVAGGGGGGGAQHGHVGGGGGAGGVVQASDVNIPVGTYTVEVGHAGNKGNQGVRGENGHDSSITVPGVATAIGGGGGGRAENQPPGTEEYGGNGGSGGGGASCDQQANTPGGSGTSGQGHSGGTSGPRGHGKGGTGGGCAGGGSSGNTGGSHAAGGSGCANSWRTGNAETYGQGGGTAGNGSNSGAKGRGGNGGYNGPGTNGRVGIVVVRCVL